MKAEHLLISGRVQGVGYRDWLVAEATRLGITGWVRNSGPDQVEAVVCGQETAIEEIVALCRQGPKWANVTGIQRTEHAIVKDKSLRRVASV